MDAVASRLPLLIGHLDDTACLDHALHLLIVVSLQPLSADAPLNILLDRPHLFEVVRLDNCLGVEGVVDNDLLPFINIVLNPRNANIFLKMIIQALTQGPHNF